MQLIVSQLTFSLKSISSELNRDAIFHLDLNSSAHNIGQQLTYSTSIVVYHYAKSLFSRAFQEIRKYDSYHFNHFSMLFLDCNVCS